MISSAKSISVLAMLAWLPCLPGHAREANLRPIGDDLSAWREPHGDWQIVGSVRPGGEDDRLLVASPGTGILVNGKSGRTRNLLTKADHGDARVHVEFMVPKGSNSGVYFQARYEIQVLDSWGVEQPKYGDCGGIYQRWRDGRGFDGHAPRTNASRPPGEWQSFDVVFKAPRFDAAGKKVENARFVRVEHNGIVVHENVELTGPTRASTFRDEQPLGPLMLQGDHGPVAYRNLKITPLDAE
jgi:hypothetical protein